MCIPLLLLALSCAACALDSHSHLSPHVLSPSVASAASSQQPSPAWGWGRPCPCSHVEAASVVYRHFHSSPPVLLLPAYQVPAGLDFYSQRVALPKKVAIAKPLILPCLLQHQICMHTASATQVVVSAASPRAAQSTARHGKPRVPPGFPGWAQVERSSNAAFRRCSTVGRVLPCLACATPQPRECVPSPSGSTQVEARAVQRDTVGSAM